MSDLIRREDAINAMAELQGIAQSKAELTGISKAWKKIKALPTASPWHRVEEPPKEAGEYIVAYHPCWWDDVETQVTKVGIDSFRGKASWAKRKTQRVTHWMEKPEPPKEDA